MSGELNHCCFRTQEECTANPTERCAGSFLKWVHEAGAHHREQPDPEMPLLPCGCDGVGGPPFLDKGYHFRTCMLRERERLKSLVLSFTENKMHKVFRDELAKLFEVSE